MARTFRLFISSPFRDLETERNVLHREVFPKLRRLCAAHGARFQAIDLRWGVSDEAGLDQKTVPLCLEEIERCQKADRPNFLVLLGDRYGWRPLPATIPAGEFDHILGEIPRHDAEVLTAWYQRDDNARPAEFYLKPRDPAGPFGTSSDPTEKRDRTQAWDAKEAELRSILLGAIARLGLGPERRAAYLASATEHEIEKGALQVPDAADHVFCLFRAIDGLPVDDSAAAYRDLLPDGTVDPEAAAALDALKARLRRRLPDNVAEYVVPWNSAAGAPDLSDYLPGFCERVERALTAAITARFVTDRERSTVDVESGEHRRVAAERAAFFTGRVDALEVIDAHLAATARRVLVIHGDSGTGKSALVAAASQRAKRQYPGAEIVVRFVGATAESAGGTSLLGLLCRQLGTVYGAGGEVPDDFGSLTELLAARLSLATAARPLLLFVDGLDQLPAGDPARRLTWLPAELPEHVRIVLSTLPGDTLDAAAARRADMLEMHPMSLGEAEDLLDAWLVEAGRALQPEQRHEVLDGFTRAAGLPLYLKLAFEEARLWRSAGPHPPLAPDVDGVIRDNLFGRLADPTNHGDILVGRALGYLAASRFGLAEDEMLDVLSRDEQVFRSLADLPYHDIPDTGEDEQRIPVVVWARFFSDLEPYLTERSADGVATLDFHHPRFRRVAASAFLAGEAAAARHGLLADLFRSKSDPTGDGSWSGDDRRGFAELPFHLTGAVRHDELVDVLTDFRFMERKAARIGEVAQRDGTTSYTGVARLREDLDRALDHLDPGAT
jgi:hypothetical protein